MGEFQAKVEGFVARYKEAADAVVRQSTQELIEQAQKSRQKGGNMPVVTGFLRASGQLSLNGFTSGPARGDGANVSAPDYTATLARAQAGDTLYFAWSAVYARRMNYKYGFLDLAVQNWQSIVDGVVGELRG